MGTTTWALPVGILSGLCVLMFLFIWWWFPRAYKKGVRADIERVDEDNRLQAEHNAHQRDLEAANRAQAGTGEDGAVQSPAAAYKHPSTFVYTPPAYTSY